VILLKPTYFNLEKNNDVIHSQESSLKVCFIFAVSLSRGPDYVHSEYDEVPKNFLDAFFNTGLGVHIEFKNTTIGHIAGQYFPKNWDRMNTYSDSLLKLSKADLLKLPLQQFPEGMYCEYLKKNMSTTGDKWASVKAQAQANRQILRDYRESKGLETNFMTYAMYRIGLKILIWEKIV